MLRTYAKYLCIGLLTYPAIANAAFFFQAEATFPVLMEEISYRDDLTNGSSIQEVMADRDGWVSQKVKPFTSTGKSIRIWARFDIPAAREAQRVFIRAPAWESVEYFVVRDGKLVDRQNAGMLRSWAERTTRVSMTPAAFHAGLVAVDIPPHANVTIIARLATENRFITITRLRFSLWDANQVVNGELRDRYSQGIFFGVMLVLLFYNLALFILNRRELSYLYYVIGVVGTTIAQGVMYGLTLEYFWPAHPAWDYYCMWIALPVSMWAFVQFVRHYLDTRTQFPRLDIPLKWAGYAGALLVVVFFVPFALDRPISLILMLLGTVIVATVAIPLLLGVVILALIKRLPLARLFFIAILCSALGAMVTFGAWLDFLPEVEWTLNASQMGTVLTGILLSMGLGFRTRDMRRELVEKQMQDERLRTAHEREKRELIEEQSRSLEQKVVERTAELATSEEKANALLANILPQAIIAELKETGESEPRRHEEVSILFTDFSGFTQAVSTMPPKRMVRELDEIFRAFDDIIAAHGMEKIKTIGDAYMAAAGLPLHADDHALRCVRAALALTRFVEARNATATMKWGVRIGVHSGSVVAGIVGKNKYAYDVWGDTVNIASRLESAGEVNRVNVSAYTFDLVRELFDGEYRGKLAAKGKGDIDMYFVLRERGIASVA